MPTSWAIAGTRPFASHFTSSSQLIGFSVAGALRVDAGRAANPCSAANQSSTGKVPGSTGATVTGSVCHAIAWPSRISNSPRQASTLQKCRRTRACA